MKTATIDYSDFEILVGAGVSLIAALENALPETTGDQRVQGEQIVAQVRATLERVATGVTVGVRAKSFQDRLAEALAAARAKQ